MTDLERDLIAMNERLMRHVADLDEKVQRYREQIIKLQGPEGMTAEKAAEWLQSHGWVCSKLPYEE